MLRCEQTNLCQRVHTHYINRGEKYPSFFVLNKRCNSLLFSTHKLYVAGIKCHLVSVVSLNLNKLELFASQDKCCTMWTLVAEQFYFMMKGKVICFYWLNLIKEIKRIRIIQLNWVVFECYLFIIEVQIRWSQQNPNSM